MKIALTGHTRGLGKSIYEQCNNDIASVIGFSKSNGFDITSAEDRKKIIELSDDCDVFINNAYDRFGQIEMLYDLYDKWKAKEKTIVTIGSYASNAAEWRLQPCLYSTVKKSLDVVTYQLVNSHDRKGCKLMIFKPSYLGNKESQIPYEFAANYLLAAIKNNTHQTIELVLR